jgi:hypothetical protein
MDVLVVLVDVAGGLDYLHSHGIIHGGSCKLLLPLVQLSVLAGIGTSEKLVLF